MLPCWRDRRPPYFVPQSARKHGCPCLRSDCAAALELEQPCFEWRSRPLLRTVALDRAPQGRPRDPARVSACTSSCLTSLLESLASHTADETHRGTRVAESTSPCPDDIARWPNVSQLNPTIQLGNVGTPAWQPEPSTRLGERSPTTQSAAPSPGSLRFAPIRPTSPHSTSVAALHLTALHLTALHLTALHSAAADRQLIRIGGMP